jgi:ATP-dependent DNA helicase Rep/DNA helicase-2/ATP-dependent DNA helicase PcrA
VLYPHWRLVKEQVALDTGTEPGDIAVFYRSLNEGKQIAEAADAVGLPYFRLDKGSPVKRSRLTEWLTDAAKWCSGGWKTESVNLSDLLRSWRSMRRSLMHESDALAARAKLISALFAHRDGSMPLHQWLQALGKEVLADAFAEEPSLSDEERILKIYCR